MWMKEHKNGVFVFVKAVVFCVILVIVCNSVFSVFERKSSRKKYEDFFEQKQDFDVLFVGTSHVINAVYPMQLWNDYGIVSYNFGGHSNTMPTTYWTMRNALDYTKPKMIVVDCSNLEAPGMVSHDFNFVHLSFDAFPLSLTKIKACYDLLPGQKNASNRLDLLWDFNIYHNRWKNLSEDDFDWEPKNEKGAEIRINVSSPVVPERTNQKADGTSIGFTYLRKLIAYCQEKQIQVMLTYLPHPASYDDQLQANKVADIAQEYGVEYLNFLDLDVVDYQTDCNDATSHLNPSGARKITEYLGRHLIENYDIPNQKENENYAEWYGDYEEYNAYKFETISEIEELDDHLMMLADPTWSSCVYFNGEAPALGDEKILRLLANITETVDYKEIKKDADAKQDCLFVYDLKKNEYVFGDVTQGLKMDTSFGKIDLGKQVTDRPFFFLQDSDFDYLADGFVAAMLASGGAEDYDAAIYQFDNRTGKLVYVAWYATSKEDNKSEIKKIYDRDLRD